MAKKAKAKKVVKVDKVIDEGKLWAFISYFWILFIIPLLVAKENKFAVYHAKQGLVLFICSIIVMVIWYIPFIGWIIGVLGSIALLILWIIGILNSLSGKYEPLPVIGKYAESIKI